MVLSVNERTFKQEVLESSTPVLVHFWAPWCGLCRLISPILIRFQAESKQNVKLVSINADESLKLANTYRLTTLPTLILFERGQVLHRLEGFNGREDLQKAMEKMMLNTLVTTVSR